MQAVILAAGMGTRIKNYTKDNPKCLIEINGETLIKRQIDSLKKAGINKIIIVCGYKKNRLQKYIKDNCKDIEIIFIENNDYEVTNNIYSLYLAKEYIKKDDIIILESDLIFEDSIIEKIIKDKNRNVAAVSKYKLNMDGTVVTINNNNEIINFIEKSSFDIKNIENYYKTINIYKLSKQDCVKFLIPCLENYINKNKKDIFYEVVFKKLIQNNNMIINTKIFENEKWYEIDNETDLEIASCLFNNSTINYEKRYGGYWNFSNLKDFCYLTNPKFPTAELLEKLKYFSGQLITQYPSGASIQEINASRLFNIKKDEIIVGNGSSELIKEIGKILIGKITVQIPVFNEYVRCFEKCEIIKNDTSKNDYVYEKNEIIKSLNKTDTMVLVNPDNPTGNFIKYTDIIDIIKIANENNKTIIVDESFIDFADRDKRYTLINHELLQKYKNLIVIKSISKSYGIPGIRLGVLASGNKELVKKIKSNLEIWNINSIAEYFLQIIELYKKDYENSCNYIEEQRNKLYNLLSQIKYLKVYKSQANYFLCKILKYNNKYIADYLLNNYNILIKDLKSKEGFKNQNYIRITVKSEEENKYLIKALKDLEK